MTTFTYDESSLTTYGSIFQNADSSGASPYRGNPTTISHWLNDPSPTALHLPWPQR